MKRFSTLIAVTALLLASLACQTVLGGGDSDVNPAPPSGGEPGGIQPPSTGGSGSVESEFPIPDDPENMTEIGGTLNFQVSMSVEEAADFYLTELTAMGYTERPILTVIDDWGFSMVFDGHESGQAIVVQCTDLENGTININIRLEDT